MDITTLLTAIGVSGLLSGLLQWFTNRKITNAQADNATADYVSKIIEQADKRVQQYEDDAKNWREKIVETETYAKEQRLAFNALREENAQLKESSHKTELQCRDLKHALEIADYARCTVNDCKKRIPPRSYSKPEEHAETRDTNQPNDAVAATVNR